MTEQYREDCYNSTAACLMETKLNDAVVVGACIGST